MRAIYTLALSSPVSLASAGITARQTTATYDTVLLPAVEAFSSYTESYSKLNATELQPLRDAGTNIILAGSVLLQTLNTTALTIINSPLLTDYAFASFIEDISNLTMAVQHEIYVISATVDVLLPVWQLYTWTALERQVHIAWNVVEAIWPKANGGAEGYYAAALDGCV